MEFAALNWTDVLRGVAAAFQIIAIVIGGAWAYYKFFKGRTLKPRAQVEVDGVLLEADDEKALSITIEFRNLGLAYVEFQEQRVSLVYVQPLAHMEPQVNVDWEEPSILYNELFRAQVGCDVGEVLTEHVLLPIPEDPCLAYRAQVVISRPPYVPFGLRWLPPRVQDRISGPPYVRLGLLRKRTLGPWTADLILPDVLRKRAVESDGDSR